MFVMSETHTRVVKDKLLGSSFSFGPSEDAQPRYVESFGRVQNHL